MVVFRSAAEETVRFAGGAAESVEVSELTRGDFGLPAVALPFAFRKGEAVWLFPGVLEREGGLLGRLIEGLSQEEKKSSEGSLGVPLPLAPSLYSAESSMTTESGFLCAGSAKGRLRPHVRLARTS